MYYINEDIFLNETALSFYLLGVFMSDGCISKDEKIISLASKDKSWIDDIRDIISPDRPIYERKRDGYTVCNILSMSNQSIAKWMISYGCTYKKSLNIEIKKEIPIKYFPDLIRGLIDGDGSIVFNDAIRRIGDREYRYKNIIISLVSASKKFLEQLQKQLLNCDQVAYIYENHSKAHYINNIWVNDSTIYCLRFSTANSDNLVKWIYYKDDLLCLDRKLIKANQIICHYNNKTNKANNSKRGRKPSINWPCDTDLISLTKTLGMQQTAIKVGCSYRSLHRKIKSIKI